LNFFYERNNGFYYGCIVNMIGDKFKDDYYYMGINNELFDCYNFKTIKTYTENPPVMLKILPNLNKSELVFLKHKFSGEIVLCNKRNIYIKEQRLSEHCYKMVKKTLYSNSLFDILKSVKSKSVYKYYGLLNIILKTVKMIVQEGDKDKE